MVKIVVGVTGASGAPYAVRILQLLRDIPGVQIHLVMSKAAALTVVQECDLHPRDVEAMATVVYRPTAIGAAIASGSFRTDAMIIAPCSIRALSAIAYCHTDDLIIRAADVTLKEGRPLLLMVRETPFHLGHLRAMTAAAEAGAIIMPPIPALYTRPKSVQDIVDHTARRALARLGFAEVAPTEWEGTIGSV